MEDGVFGSVERLRQEDATWEPEQHLVNCKECIHDFNCCHSEKQKEGTFSRANQTSPNNGQKRFSRSTNRSFSKAALKALEVGKEQEAKSSPLVTSGQKFRKREHHAGPGRPQDHIPGPV